MPRPTSTLLVAASSLVLLAGLLYLVYSSTDRRSDPSAVVPLRIYCAAALKVPLQAIAADFERETGGHLDCEFGDSGAMLGSVTVRQDGDLFLPADDSFVRIAEERGLVTAAIALCRMRAVILTGAGNPHQLRTYHDLQKPGLKLGIANPDKAAIGKVVKNHLTQAGLWNELSRQVTAQQITVTDSANAVKLGSLDAAIVWDAVAAHYPELVTVRVPELDGAVGRVALGLLAASRSPDRAREFARYIVASDRGMVQFRKAGFQDLDPGPPWIQD